MINYLTTWAQVTADAYNEGNLALFVWGFGAQVLPFAVIALALAGVGLWAFKMWEDNF
jgi:hypothetical protein